MPIENPILFAITMLQDYKGDLARRDFPDNDEGDHLQRVNENKRASVDAAIAELREQVPVSGQVGGVDPEMPLPCDVRLPGGMQIGKGCKLSTLLLSFRNRGDDVPWRQRFSVPVPYDPALLSINPAPAKAEPAITSVDQLFADTKCLLCGDTGHVPIDDPVDADITTVPCWVCSDADHVPTGIDSEGGSHD